MKESSVAARRSHSSVVRLLKRSLCETSSLTAAEPATTDVTEDDLGLASGCSTTAMLISQGKHLKLQAA